MNNHPDKTKIRTQDFSRMNALITGHHCSTLPQDVDKLCIWRHYLAYSSIARQSCIPATPTADASV